MTCRLMCKNGEVIEVAVDVASQSVLIKGLIEDGGTDDDIPIAQVNSSIMEKVKVFMEHMKDNAPPEIEKPLSSTDLSQVVDQWHADYINVD